MAKNEKRLRYNDKTGMTILGACFGYCLSVAILISIAISSDKVGATVKNCLLCFSVIFVVVDIVVRVVHYILRRQNEKIVCDEKDNRYVSMLEKITYWLLKVCSPIYVVVMAIVTILLGL